MTDQRDTSDRLEESRRSLMKKGAAAGALALGTSGMAAAQDDDEEVVDDEGWKALIFISQFNPRGQFAIVSDVVDWTPNYGDVQDSWFSDYNTYQIRWQNTDNVVPLFVAEDAPIGEYDDDLGFITDDEGQEQPQLYEMDREWTPFGDNDRLITVNVSPVSEDEENQILDTEDWWDGDEEALEDETETPTGNQTGGGT